MSDVFAWWTVFVFVLFIAIVVWVFRGKRKKGFEQAARIPLEDDDGPTGEAVERGENKRG